MAERNTNIDYSAEDIERCLKGQMSLKEMHGLEKAALQDPFLADAIEGFSNTSFEESRKHLNEITAALQTRKEETKVVPLPSKSFYWWRVAAIIIFIAGIGVASWYIIGSNNAANKNEIAQMKENKNRTADTVADKELKNETMKSDSAQKLFSQNGVSRSLQKEKKKIDVQKREEVTRALTKTQPSGQKIPGTTTGDSFDAQNKDAAANISSLSVRPLNDSASNNITGRVTDASNSADSAYPSGGWKLFQEYVYKKLGKFVDTLHDEEVTGRVQIEFSIDNNGVPYNFTVLKSLSDETASKAIEIIKEGPRWIATSADKKGRVAIKF